MKNNLKKMFKGLLLSFVIVSSFGRELAAQSGFVGAFPHEPFRANIADFDKYSPVGWSLLPMTYTSGTDFDLFGTHIKSPRLPHELVAVSWIGAFDNADEYNYESLFDSQSGVGVVLAKDGDSMKEMLRLGTVEPDISRLNKKFFIRNSGAIKVQSPQVKIDGFDTYPKLVNGQYVHRGWFLKIQAELTKPIRLPSNSDIRIFPYASKTKAQKTWHTFYQKSRGSSPTDVIINKSPGYSAGFWTSADWYKTNGYATPPASAFEQVLPLGVYLRPIKVSSEYNANTRKVEVRWPESAQGLYLQSSSDLKTWSDVFTTPIDATTAQPHIVDPLTGPFLSFRLVER